MVVADSRVRNRFGRCDSPYGWQSAVPKAAVMSTESKACRTAVPKWEETTWDLTRIVLGVARGLRLSHAWRKQT